MFPFNVLFNNCTNFKMVKNCSAPNCKNRADKSLKKGVTFHLFPRIARKRKNWLKQMTDSSLASWEPSAYSVICSEHFEDSSFRYLNGKRLVKDDAFPTKFLFSKEKTEIARVSPELPIEMRFIPTETGVFIDNLTNVDEELNNSIELSECEQTTNDKQTHLNQIVSAYEQDLVITEEHSSQVDLGKSEDLAVNIMFEVDNFPESSEQMIYPAEEADLNRECISQFIEEVHLEIVSDLTGHIEESHQPSQVPPPSLTTPLSLLPSPPSSLLPPPPSLLPPPPSLLPPPPPLPKNRTNLECNEKNKNKTIASEKKDSQSPKGYEKVKTAKDYRGPSKKAKLAITLFRKAMRLSKLGFDVFLVVQELPHCTTYWGTKDFAEKFMLSKPLVDFKKSRCYNAEDLYDISNGDDSVRPSVDDKITMQNHSEPLLDSADHTYSLSNNNVKDGHWKGSVADQTMTQPAKDSTLYDVLLPSSDPNGSSLVMDQRNIVQRSEKNCLSDKIDQLIQQNEEICFTSSFLSAYKTNDKAKTLHHPSVKYDSSTTNSYNKDGHWKGFVADQMMTQPAKDSTLYDVLIPSSDANGSSLVMDERNIVTKSEKNCLSNKIDQLIVQNEEICFTSSVLSACKTNEKAKTLHHPSIKYDSSVTNSYNFKDNLMNALYIEQEYLVQQSNQRKKTELLKKFKNSEHNAIK